MRDCLGQHQLAALFHIGLSEAIQTLDQDDLSGGVVADLFHNRGIFEFFVEFRRGQAAEYSSA